MKEFKFGTYIKKRRKELGISQEDLCEGLCSVSTLSRLENNQQTPSRSLARQLLERLGLPKNRFIALWDQQSISAEALVREIRSDMIEFRRLRKEIRPQFQEKILEKLMELEEIIDPEDRSARQFLLAQQARLGSATGQYSIEQKLAMQLEAIRLTCPQFDPDDFRQGHYSTDESMLINQIAQTYFEAGEKRRSTDMYHQLIWNIERNDKELTGYASHFSLVAHNYAIILTLEKRYEETIGMAERGRKVCIDHGTFQFLPGFLAIQAECNYFLGNIENSRKLYQQAYSLYESFEDEINLENIRQEMKSYLGCE